LIEDTTIELNMGCRYGLIGRNGCVTNLLTVANHYLGDYNHFSISCGKSTFLKCLAAREIPIPPHFDIYLLAHEAPPGEDSALDYVINSAREEVARIDAEIENILMEEGIECCVVFFFKR